MDTLEAKWMQLLSWKFISFFHETDGSKHQLEVVIYKNGISHFQTTHAEKVNMKLALEKLVIISPYMAIANSLLPRSMGKWAKIHTETVLCCSH